MVTNISNTGNIGNISKMSRTMRTLAITGVITSLVALAAPFSAGRASAAGEPVSGPKELSAHLSFEGTSSAEGGDRLLEIALSQEGKVLMDIDTTVTPKGIFNLPMGDLKEGTYKLWVKSPRFLAKQVDVKYSGDTGQAELGTVIAGDADDDNVITVQDFMIVRATLFKALGDPGYDERADFNYDNRVTVVDWSMMRNKQGLAGPAHP